MSKAKRGPRGNVGTAPPPAGKPGPKPRYIINTGSQLPGWFSDKTPDSPVTNPGLATQFFHKEACAAEGRLRRIGFKGATIEPVRPWYHVMSALSNHFTIEEAVEARKKCDNPASDILLYEPDGEGGWTYRKVG